MLLHYDDRTKTDGLSRGSSRRPFGAGQRCPALRCWPPPMAGRPGSSPPFCAAPVRGVWPTAALLCTDGATETMNPACVARERELGEPAQGLVQAARRGLETFAGFPRGVGPEEFVLSLRLSWLLAARRGPSSGSGMGHRLGKKLAPTTPAIARRVGLPPQAVYNGHKRRVRRGPMAANGVSALGPQPPSLKQGRPHQPGEARPREGGVRCRT